MGYQFIFLRKTVSVLIERGDDKMSGIATSIKKAASIIVVTWILSLVTTLAVVYVAPNILPLQTTQISDNAVTSEKIADTAIITTKLADGSVTSAKIQNGTLTAVDLADGSIITIKIADSAVTTSKIGDRAITTAKVADSAVTTDKLADDAVTTDKIGDDAVTAEKIFDSAVVTTKLADGSVTSAKIQNGTLTAVDLADGSIITIKIADGAVTTAKIADSAVTSEKIADSAVVTTKLADGSVTSAKIQNGTLKAAFSFLIWRDGSTYYAKNGSTGVIQYFGTNATTVINNAISSIPTGGLVFLCDATYNIDGTINVVGKLNINIIGQSWETKLNLTQNSNTDMMYVENSNYTTIKSIYFQGNRDSQTSGNGIYVHNSERILIERCQFYEIRQTAIHINGTWPMSSLQPWIVRNRIEKIGNSTTDYGIWIGDYASDAHIVDNDVGRVTGSAIYVTSSGFLIAANTLWDSNYGLNVYSVTSGVITGNIMDNNGLDGINIDSCQNLLITSNIAKLNSNNLWNSSSGIYLYNSSYTIITGNRAGSFGEWKNETQQYGIKEYGVNSDYNLITGNNVYGNIGEQDIYSTGPNTVVSANLGRYTAKNTS
jgi:hypothetical protein